MQSVGLSQSSFPRDADDALLEGRSNKLLECSFVSFMFLEGKKAELKAEQMTNRLIISEGRSSILNFYTQKTVYILNSNQ